MAYEVTVTTNLESVPGTSDDPNVPRPGIPVAGDLLLFVPGFTAPDLTAPDGFGIVRRVENGDSLWLAARQCDGSETADTIVGALSTAGDWGVLGILIHADGMTLSIESTTGNSDTPDAVGAGDPIALNSASGVATAGPDRLMLYLSSTASGGEDGSIATLTLPDGFSEDGRVEDDHQEFISCASKLIPDETTADYDGEVTFTTGGHYKTYIITVAISAEESGGGGGMGVVQTKAIELTGATGASYTITPDAPFTEDNLVVITSSNYMDGGNGVIASVTINGVAAALAIANDDTVFEETIWYGYAGGGSAGAVLTLTDFSNAIYINSAAVELDNAVASSPLDTTGLGTGTGIAPSATLSPPIAQADEFIAAVMGGQNGATDTITTPIDYVQLYVESDGSNQVPCAAAYKIVDATGTQTATFAQALPNAYQVIMASFKLAGGGGTVVDLTGISATSALGSFAPKLRSTLTGSQATAATGAMAPRIKPALAGVAATAALGVLVPAMSVGLSGVSAASAEGAFGVRVTPFLTTILATGQLGTLAPPGGVVVNLSGIAASSALGTLAPRTKPTLAGVSAATAQGALLSRIRPGLSGVLATPAVGSFSVSIAPRLTGVQAQARVGSFVSDSPQPKLVSITFTNVGLAATTTISLAGVNATTTLIDLD